MAVNNGIQQGNNVLTSLYELKGYTAYIHLPLNLGINAGTHVQDTRPRLEAVPH